MRWCRVDADEYGMLKGQGAEGWEKGFYEGFGNRRFVGRYVSLCMLIRKW